MQVDWFTVVAQVINFLVLVYLLKRFLYGPIIDAMDRREQLIAERLHAADDKAAEAEHASQNYQTQISELEERKEAILDEARQEVHSQRIQEMEELRKEIAATRTRWHEEVELEKDAFLREARKGIGKQACDIAHKVLQELAGAELEQELIRMFLKRLRQMDADEREALAAALQEQKEAIVVATGFEVAAGLQQEITTVLGELSGTAMATQFVRSDKLLCGIALQLPAHKIVWSIDDYLDNLEQSLAGVLTTPATIQQTQVSEGA
jgi:F-type H+-transporting ATPase subunit b